MFCVQGDQPIGCHSLQGGPLRGKVAPKVDVEGVFYRGERQVQVADDLLNDLAANSIVLIAQQPSAGGELAAAQRVLVLRQVAVVLTIKVADLANGRYAQADQVAMTVGGVALKIALQC